MQFRQTMIMLKIISITGRERKFRVTGVVEDINFNSEVTICPAKRCACPLNKYDEYLFEKASSALE